MVDTRAVEIHIDSEEDVQKAHVGQLVALSMPGQVEEWLIGITGKVDKTYILETLPTK